MAKERIFWAARKKTTGSVMINSFLKIMLRSEGILQHLWKFCTA